MAREGGRVPANIEEFSAEVRAFLDASVERRPDPSQAVQWGAGEDRIAYFSTDPPEVDQANARRARKWQRRRYDAGFGWIPGPAEFGGRGLSTGHDLTYDTVESQYDVPDTGVLSV